MAELPAAVVGVKNDSPSCFGDRSFLGGISAKEQVRSLALIQLNTSIDHKPVARRSLANPFGAPVWKRALDCGLILLAAPVLLPLMVLIAALVRLVSSGPIFFRQERIGFRGSRFMCLKFRTMFVGVDTAVHRGHLNDLMTSNAPMVKMDSHGDPRLIPFGLWLRSSGLDELPQIINVLRGEMSLVGPRPCIAYEYEKYTEEQKERFNTLPGLTGWWQVSGKNRTTFTEMIQLDIDYARRKSLWFDIKIIFKTLPAILAQIRDVLARKARRQSIQVGINKTGGEISQAILPQRPVPVRVRAEETKVQSFQKAR